MIEQELLSSFNASVRKANKIGYKYDEIIKVGSWELIFSKPRKSGQLPTIKHAVYKP